jgi:aspartate kinase
MSGVTNNLINLSKKISKNFSDSEYDVLVSSGEQMSCALISGELINNGFNSRSWMSWQIPINTEGIYTDVDGVYSTDPNKLKSAKKIKVISYEEMLEMASLGAKVMQPHSIQDARLNRVDIEVRSSFTDNEGTIITKRKNIINNKIITGISNTTNDAKVTLLGVRDKPGIAASIFKPLSENSINVDMVVQNISANGKETDLTFTIKSDDLSKTKKIILQNKKINFRDLIFDKNVSKVSIIGVGMVTTPGVTYRMFQSLAKQKINIQVISTSEIKISVLIDKKNVRKAISSLHKEFKLNK